MRRAWVIITVVALGCDRQQVVLFDGDGGPTSADAAMIPGLRALEIRPPSARFAIDGAAPFGSVMFQAIGSFDDGERDVSALVGWTLEDDFLGTIAAGLFETRRAIGGSTIVRAVSGDVAAQASLTVFLELESTAAAPAGAADLFVQDPAIDDTGSARPLIIYPSDETIFPVNTLYTRFQWRAPDAHDLFELRFESSVAEIRHYTTERAFLLDESWRDALARTHAGRSVSVTIRSVATGAPMTVYRSTPIRIEYSRSEVLGSIYYWSTGAAAIMRATLDSPAAQKFLPGEDDDKCGSCHTVSRDGRRVALGYDGENLRIASVPDRETLYPNAGQTAARYGWSTFSPDGMKLLVANKGVLSIVDVASGLAEPVPLPSGMFATHPDWSPDGAQVAFALTPSAPGNKEVKGSSLARMAVLGGGSFATPEVIIARTDSDDTIAFPSHSPDSRWIAFVRTRGKSKDSRPAELYLVRADGSGTPILLERLNRRVRDEDGRIDLANSMPTWAPSTRPEINWLAFSSIRDYGDVLVGSDRDQLWAAAIDLDRASAGADPSAAAFWLPFQEMEEGNHRAFWSLNPEDACPSTVELCDGLDNNCDGLVDDACCTPVDEVCGDQRDNDCDLAIDEACGCAATETCSNGTDDDCDMLIDLDDEDCTF